MSDITNRIKLFHSLYTACLSGAAIFAGISVFLYLYLDIRTAVRVLAGVKRVDRPKRRKNFQGENTESLDRIAEISDGQELTVGLWAKASGKAYEKTDVMHMKVQAFLVEKEILVVHTDVTVSDKPQV